MRIYRAVAFDTPGELPAASLRAEQDAGIAVAGGVITARGPFVEVRERYPQAEVVDLREGVLLPGLVDTHVHYPQVRAIGGLGMGLLEWLEKCALPEEARLAEVGYARAVAREFLDGLRAAGTTTALVFGSHFATAMDVFFTEAERSGLRITSGLVTSDRILRAELLSTPARALAEGRELAETWHGRGRLRYAVTPRFSLTASEEMLEACAELLAADRSLWFTSHVNENSAEIAKVAELFSHATGYVETYTSHGLLSARSVLAHNVHPAEGELALLAGAGTGVVHCPTSNAALGSGSFPMREHLAAGVPVALGSDVGAGAGFSILDEGRQAYYTQQLLGDAGMPLTSAQLLHLATRSGAQVLGMADDVGDLSVGRQFDACHLVPHRGSTLERVLRHATDPADVLAKIFTLATPADVAGTWVGGELTQEAA